MYLLLLGGRSFVLCCALALTSLVGCGDEGAGPIPDVTSIAASGFLSDDGHTIALLSNGQVVGWGVATRTVPDLAGNDTLYAGPKILDIGPGVQIAAGGYLSCVLRGDGTVECLAADPRSTFQASQVAGLVDAVSIAAGGAFACAVRGDGTVVRWEGSGADGVFVEEGFADAVQVALGYQHICALDALGRVDCVGPNNDVGQLGDGTTDSSGAVVRVLGTENMRALAAGGRATCAVAADRTVVCWGYLGEGIDDYDRGSCGSLPSPCWLSPTPIEGLTNIVAIGVGKEHACALDDAHVLRCWGGNRAGQLGTGDLIAHTAPIEVRNDVRLLAVGRLHTCVVTTAGEVLCVGDDDDSQLGTRDDPPSTCVNVVGERYPCSPTWLGVPGFSRP